MNSSLFIKYLAVAVYGNPVDFWIQISEDQRKQICAYAEKEHFELFLYRSLGSQAECFLPQYTTPYMHRSGFCMLDERKLNALYAEFERADIRFAPIKGIDFAYRVYPSSESRYYIDWDILFHPEDCVRALRLLHELGWKADKAFSETKRPQGHHYPNHRKDNTYMEPHWTLPKFQNVPPEDLWNYLTPVPGSSHKFVLSPELNILMLTRHFTSQYYTHVSIPKLLSDVAYLLKNQRVNWTALADVAKRFQMPNPCNFLAAFDDFFPADLISEMHADQEVVKIYKQIFRLQDSMTEYDTRELEMNNFSIDSGASWIARRFRAFAPSEIRNRYNLPLSGAYFNLALCYLRCCCRKIGEIFTYVWRFDSKMRYYNRLIRKIESEALHGKRCP